MCVFGGLRVCERKKMNVWSEEGWVNVEVHVCSHKNKHSMLPLLGDTNMHIAHGTTTNDK